MTIENMERPINSEREQEVFLEQRRAEADRSGVSSDKLYKKPDGLWYIRDSKRTPGNQTGRDWSTDEWLREINNKF